MNDSYVSNRTAALSASTLFFVFVSFCTPACPIGWLVVFFAALTASVSCGFDFFRFRRKICIFCVTLWVAIAVITFLIFMNKHVV